MRKMRKMRNEEQRMEKRKNDRRTKNEYAKKRENEKKPERKTRTGVRILCGRRGRWAYPKGLFGLYIAKLMMVYKLKKNRRAERAAKRARRKAKKKRTGLRPRDIERK
jgi:hypothetical protein